MGYHQREIRRGELGKLSKLREELDELADAEAQSNRILMLCELADLYGAIELYLESQFGDKVNMKDVATMAKATRSAFEEGSRS